MKFLTKKREVVLIYLLSYFFHMFVTSFCIFIASLFRGNPYFGLSYFACISCEKVLTPKTLGNFTVISLFYLFLLLIYFLKKNRITFEIITLSFLTHFVFCVLFFVNNKIEQWFCSDIAFFSVQHSLNLPKYTFFLCWISLYCLIVLRRDTIRAIIYRSILSFISFGIYFTIFSKIYRYIFVYF